MWLLRMIKEFTWAPASKPSYGYLFWRKFEVSFNFHIQSFASYASLWHFTIVTILKRFKLSGPLTNSTESLRPKFYVQKFVKIDPIFR